MGTELRWTSPTDPVQAQLAVGAGIGQIVQPDPLRTQRTPLGLYTNASAGIAFRQSAQVRWALEVAMNRWAGMGDLGQGGARYHMPLDRPYWLASVVFTPGFSP